MNILNTYIHKLRFSIDSDAPSKYLEKWYHLKQKCETGDNKDIVKQIKNNSKLDMNKNLPYLNRSEGGLGGDNNINNKQIRFRDNWGENDYRDQKDDNIILHEITNGTDEIWTYKELDDLIYSFTKVANNYLGTECVKGSIEMIDKNTLDDKN